MPATPVRLGPFTGGMNTLSDAAALADNELVDCINLEIDLDGSLRCRSPITDTPGPVAWGANYAYALGFFSFPTGDYLLVSTSSGIYYKLGAAAWVLIAGTATLTSFAAVQYSDSVFIVAIPGSTTGSGKWDPTNGFSLVSGMPKGQAIVVYKDRGFIAPGELSTSNRSRLYFSKVTDLTDWTTGGGVTGTVDVNPGDGQQLIDIIVHQDSVVCFKQDSTYVFSYTTAPAQAILQVINTTIGVSTKDCVVSFENNLYLYHEGAVYEMSSLKFTRINYKVPFSYDATSPGTFVNPIFMCLFGERVLIRYYHRIYVYGLRTGTWTRWETSEYFGILVPEPVNVLAATNPRYFGGSCISNSPAVFNINDGFDNVQSEVMTCSMTTKTFDMSHQIRVGRYFVSQAEKFKKLFWWGLDVLTNNDVTGTTVPVTFSFKPTWGQLANFKWGDLNTWGFPLTQPAIIDTSVDPGSGNFRRFLKFPKALRFRQIYFKVDITTQARSVDGPEHIYDIVAMVKTAETVVEAVS